ncbi:MAG TPA: response regulator [Phycisphaerae bacterium]|nr:response regulator [Phycisphaerae bacterium]
MRKVLNILVVDGNSHSRSLFRMCLSQHIDCDIHKIREAATGIDALTLLAQEAFDVCFLGLDIPDMNADELVHYVRQCSDTGGVSLIVMGDVAEFWTLNGQGRGFSERVRC